MHRPFAHIPPCPKGAHVATLVQVMGDRRYCIRCRVYVVAPPKVVPLRELAS